MVDQRQRAAYQAGQRAASRQLGARPGRPSGSAPLLSQVLTQQGHPLLTPGKGVVPAPDDGNPLRRLGGDAVNAAMWLLDAGNKFVTRPAGGLLAQQGIDPRYFLPWKGGLDALLGPGHQLGREISPRLHENLTEEQRQVVEDAQSYTQAFRAAMAGDAWNQLGLEALYDPLNIVGGGIAGKLGKAPKVAKVLESSPGLARAFDAVKVADDLAGRAQALPIEWGVIKPARAAGRALNRVRPGLLDLTPRSRLLKAAAQRGPVAQALRERGLRADEAQGSLLTLTAQDVVDGARRADDLPAFTAQLDTPSLTRLWDAPDAPTPARVQARKELTQRGLLREQKSAKSTRFLPTERLRAHQQLDDTLLVHQFGDDTASQAHAALDAFASAIYADNPGRFPDLDDVYRQFQIAPTFDDAAPAGAYAQSLTDLRAKLARGEKLTDADLDDEVRDEVVRVLGGASPEETLNRLRRMNTLLGPELAKQAAEWYPDAGYVFHLLFDPTPLKDLPQGAEIIQRLADPANVDPNFMAQRYKWDGKKWVGVKKDPAVDRLAVNPLLEEAKAVGLTDVAALDPATVDHYRALGVNLENVDAAGYLQPSEASKVVADLLGTRSMRDIALAGWAAGGNGRDPFGNMQVAINWADNLLRGERAGTGWQTPITMTGFDQFRRYLLLGERGLLNGDIWNDYLKVPVNPAKGEIVPGHFRTPPAEAMPQPGEINEVQDKILNYTWLAEQYAHLWDQFTAIRAAQGETAARAYWDQAEAAINAAPLDRRMRDELAWDRYGTRTGKVSSSMDPKPTSPSGAVMADQPDWLAEKIMLNRILWPLAQADPELARLYPNLGAFQAGLWVVPGFEQLYSAGLTPGGNLMHGRGSLLDTVLRGVFGGKSGQPLDPADVAQARVAREAAWEQLTPEAARSVTDLQRPTSYLGSGNPHITPRLVALIQEGVLRPADLDDAARLLGVSPEELVSGAAAVLTQLKTVTPRTRGSFLPLGPDGPFLIRLTPAADVTTLPHELGHGYRRLAGPETQQLIQQGLGSVPASSVAGEESVAEGVENLLRTLQADPSNPEAARRLAAYQRLTDAVYAGGTPTGQLPPAVAARLVDEIRGIHVGNQVSATIPPGQAGPLYQTTRVVPEQARRLIEATDTAILTAERGGLSAGENALRNGNLLADLQAMGAEVTPVLGHYSDEGVVENSFAVTGLTREQAVALGRKYEQESIIWSGDGLVYTTGPHAGHVVPKTGISLNGPEPNYYSELVTPEGNLKFAYTLDDDAWPVGQAGRPGPEPGAASGSDAEVRFDPPLARATVPEVVTQVAGEIRAPREAIAPTVQLLEPLQQANPDHWQAANLWFAGGKLRPHLERMLQATDDASRRAAFMALAREANQTWDAFGVRVPRVRRLIDAILGPNRQRLTPLPGEVGRSSFGSSLTDEATEIANDLASRPEFQQWERDFNQAALQVQDIAARQGLPFDDFTTIKDVARLRDSLTDPAQREIVERYLKLGDYLADDGVTFRDLYALGAMDAWARSAAAEFGVDLAREAPGKLGAQLRQLRRAWTEQALLSVRYHGQNVGDMLIKSAVLGHNPLLGFGARNFGRQLGIDIPAAVADPRALGVAGGLSRDLEEFASQRTTSALGQLVGKLSPTAGAAADRVVRWNRGMANTMESVFRSSAWQGTVQHQLAQAQPLLVAEIQRDLGPAAAQRVAALGSTFSPERLTQVLTEVGADATTSRRLADQWGRIIAGASEDGINEANHIHFDFLDERNVEELLHVRAWAPFHFWATRNVPFYTETLAQHPWMLRLWSSYYDLSEEERERLGLTSRFRQTLPFPGADPLLSTLLGPGSAYFNPLVIMSIADQLKPTADDPESTALGRALQGLGRVGLRPAPWVDIPLTALGIYGPDQEPFGVLRHSGLIEDVTGALGYPVDVEAPLMAAVRRVQGTPDPTSARTLAGIPISGSAYEDYQISKRLAEMSIEEAGTPNAPAYVAAMADPSSPLYQRAQADVRQARLAQGLLSFTVPMPVKWLPDTEAAVRTRAAALQPVKDGMDDATRRTFNRALAQSGDLATGMWNVTSDPGIAQIQAGMTSSGGFLPNAAGRLARDRVLAQYPLLAQYYAWLATLPPGADRSPAAFVQSQR